MAQLPDPVRACINEALARSSRLFERAVQVASQSLQEEAEARSGNTREWRNLQDAALELARRGRQARDGFPDALRQVLEGTPAALPLVRRAGDGPQALSLVDDGEITLSIETARLLQQVAPTVETSLAELDALMSAALGLDGIHPGSNPLRPALIAGEVRRHLMEPSPESAEWPVIWLRHLAAPLAHDLEQLYRVASRLLTQAGVQAAAYRVVTAQSPLTSRPAPLEPISPAAAHDHASPGLVGAVRAAAAAMAAPVSAWFHSAGQVLRGPGLREFLGGRRMPSLQQPLGSGWYHHVEQELARLETAPEQAPPQDAAQRHEHLAPVDRPARSVGTSTPLRPDHWGAFAAPRQRSLVRTRLKQQARQVDQALGIELVHHLLDEMAQDARLLTPVREAMVALEPALARLALDEPRFFGQASHPGRGLLEGVADRSFRFNDEFDPAFERFIAPVRERFNRLNRDEAQAVEPSFARALDELQAGWAEEDRAQAERHQAVLESVRFAERRQALAEEIAQTLAQRSDLEGSPAPVQEFLFQRWALVLAHARLEHAEGVPDRGGYLAVVTDLLWSVKPALTMRAPARAFEVIPPLLGRLRSGLALVGQTAAESESFFSALEQLHGPVLRLRAVKRAQGAPVPRVVSPAGLAPAAAQKPQPAQELWLAPVERQACGLQQEPEAEPAALDDAAVLAAIASLGEGRWVDLCSHGQWRRARLVWRGTRGTLFMFVGESGEPHSMSRRILQRLLAQRLLRPVETGPVVQQALDTLAHAQPQALAA